uniref:Uncharacterized protein n=1 Tax=Periophthalmus magnuspinnatus TaxID=409849 RepID=A0A3B4A0N2_9GOBI
MPSKKKKYNARFPPVSQKLMNRKQCIELEQQFDFLKDLVATVPDMQGEGEDNHTEGGGEKIPKRGRKPGTGRKNGGAGAKGKDKKLSGTESEQEEESEDSETDGDEEDGSQSKYPVHYPPRPPMFHEPPPLPPVPHAADDDDEDYDS